MRKNWSGEAARSEDGISLKTLSSWRWPVSNNIGVYPSKANICFLPQMEPGNKRHSDLICLKKKLDIYSHLASYLKIMYIWLHFLWKTSCIRSILILKHDVLIEIFFLFSVKKIYFFTVFTQDWKMYSQNRFVWFYAQVAELLS